MSESCAPVLGKTLYVCGLTHAQATVEVRERYALIPEEAARLTRILCASRLAEQVMILSTCNRIEIYAFSARPQFAGELRELFLGLDAGRPSTAARATLLELSGAGAVRHLFAVEAGLESMILGENQIKQQIRQAYEICRREGGSGPDMHRLIETAHRVGKRVRTETELNVGTMCVAKAAVLRGEAVLGELRGKVCLVIGAGKVGRIAARALAERQPARLCIINRTIVAAREIADELGGEAHGLPQLGELLPDADLIVGAAGAPELVLNSSLFRATRVAQGIERTVCMIDAAVPRIFDPELAKIDGVRLYDIEHLEEVISKNRRQRKLAARKGWNIVEEEVANYFQSLRAAELARGKARTRTAFDDICDEKRLSA